MDLEYEPELELNPREYVCETCRLVHWRGAPDPCDRAF
jgi:hypothetical protein